MKKLWTALNEAHIKKTTKSRLFLGLMTLISLILGGLIWLGIGRLALPGLVWLFCFIGYPAIIFGIFGGILYLYRHEFR